MDGWRIQLEPLTLVTSTYRSLTTSSNYPLIVVNLGAYPETAYFFASSLLANDVPNCSSPVVKVSLILWHALRNALTSLQSMRHIETPNRSPSISSDIISSCCTAVKFSLTVSNHNVNTYSALALSLKPVDLSLTVLLHALAVSFHFFMSSPCLHLFNFTYPATRSGILSFLPL